MTRFLQVTLVGFSGFIVGMLTQYLLPVTSSEVLVDCDCENTKPLESDIYPTKETIIPEKIRNHARQITVQVIAGDNSGSGILIRRSSNLLGAEKNNFYQILTCDHVLLFGKQQQSFQIKTYDGKVYPAKMLEQYNFSGNDLGILQFKSQEEYEIVTLSSAPLPQLGEKVYAVGYPYQSADDIPMKDNFTFLTGTVDLISNLSFRGGYQIGSSHDVKQGMSGGPLFNSRGEIIGINGRRKYPVWGNPYIFKDGTIATPEQKEEMSKSSWAIPINFFVKSVPQFITNYQTN